MAGANHNDFKFKMARETIESIVIERPEPTEEEPEGMCLDKGHDYAEIHLLVTEFGFTAHIRARGEEAQAIKEEAGYKARRWVVERTHSRENLQLDEPLSSVAGALGKEAAELHCHAPYRLRLHHFQRGRRIKIKQN